MAYRRSALEELARMRTRGQRPDMPVVVGDQAARAWAERNRFFFVPLGEIGDDLAAFAGLAVIARASSLRAHREVLQRLALIALIVVAYDREQRMQTLLAA